MPALFDEVYSPIERAGRFQGRPHTQHFTGSPGLGRYRADGAEDGWVFAMDAAMLKQERGSSSSIAMQRGSAVELFGGGVIADDGGIREWRITGLRLQKFRDTLARVSSVWDGFRGLGLGL